MTASSSSVQRRGRPARDLDKRRDLRLAGGPTTRGLKQKGVMTHVGSFLKSVMFHGRRALKSWLRDRASHQHGLGEAALAAHQRADTAADHAGPDAQDRWGQLTNAIPGIAWACGPNGEIRAANDEWLAYVGRTRSEAGALDWHGVIHPEDWSRWQASWTQAQANSTSLSVHLRYRRSEGGYRCFLVQARPIRDDHGRLEGWLGTAQDIEDQKQAQRERTELLAREQAMRLEAEAITRAAQIASRSKDEFLATLSHELRTPLNAILGWTQTLRSGSIRNETLERALAQIQESAAAQAKLIDELLNVSDIVTGRLRLDVQPMRVVPAINAALQTLHPAISAKELALETHFDPEADVIYGDPARVQQVAWNVLSNAVKFTQRGGKISATLRAVDGYAEFSISDNGEGISTEFLPHIFERFRQADSSSRKRHGGLGLGLAIARHLVEMHGGTVAVRSAGEGMGSTFVIRLPLTEVHPEPPATFRRPPAESAHAARRTGLQLEGLRILAVDDDANTREMLQEALESLGAEVQAAASAHEALELLPQFRPDVILSDIGMPREDGYDLMRKLRSLPASKGGTVPAVALTGYAREEDVAASRRAGYQAVTKKPVKLAELAATLLGVTHRTEKEPSA
jgi:PAS domain S-box-containing protein